jgi:hypothetical protein
METVEMEAPAYLSAAQNVVFKDGTTAPIGSNGQVSVPLPFIVDMIGLGFVVVTPD